jgi:hypothetical protein
MNCSKHFERNGTIPVPHSSRTFPTHFKQGYKYVLKFKALPMGTGKGCTNCIRHNWTTFIRACDTPRPLDWQSHSPKITLRNQMNRMIHSHPMSQTVQTVPLTPTPSKDQVSNKTILSFRMLWPGAARCWPAADMCITVLTSEK